MIRYTSVIVECSLSIGELLEDCWKDVTYRSILLYIADRNLLNGLNYIQHPDRTQSSWVYHRLQ